MLIQNTKIEKYNNLLLENSGVVKKLYQRDKFPKAVMDLEFSLLNKDDYVSLIDCCGEKNTQAILGKIGEFHKNWVVFNSYLVPRNKIKEMKRVEESNKKFIANLSDCLVPQVVSIDTRVFFDSLLKSKDIKKDSNIVFTGWLYGYGSMIVPYDLAPKPNMNKNLKLSLFDNLVCFDYSRNS